MCLLVCVATARGCLCLRLCLSHYAKTQGYSGCLLGVSPCLLQCFTIRSRLSTRTRASRTALLKAKVRSQPELSVSVIGWLVVIDGARPTGPPPKSIQTVGKDEMAARKLSHTRTHTQTPTPCLNGSPLFKTPSIS